MAEWKEYKFTEAATLTNGRAYLQPELQDAGKYKIVRVGNLSGGDKWFYSDMELPEEKYCHKGDLLYAWACSFGPYIWNEDKTIYHYHIWKVDVNKAITDKYYLYYYLKYYTPKWMGLTNGSVMMHITKGSLEKQIISLPDLGTQRHISSILSSLDDKIAVNKKICENLEAQAQALFKHWFVDFAPFKDGKFVESELGLIPEGWRVGTFSDLGEIVGGATPSKAESSYFTDKGIPWLTPKDLSNDLKKFTSRGEIDITENGYKSCSAKIMPRGSVLFSSRAPIGYLTIAKNSICTNQGFKSVVPKYAGTAYIYYLLKLNTKRIESMSTGTTFKEASGALMKSLAVVLPSKSILDAFESKVLDIFNEQEILETESSRLATLRDTLLPKLMSGQIKV